MSPDNSDLFFILRLPGFDPGDLGGAVGKLTTFRSPAGLAYFDPGSSQARVQSLGYPPVRNIATIFAINYEFMNFAKKK